MGLMCISAGPGCYIFRDVFVKTANNMYLILVISRC
jgi:hypothetical protein